VVSHQGAGYPLPPRPRWGRPTPRVLLAGLEVTELSEVIRGCVRRTGSYEEAPPP
jgi:hypothetical protein